MTQQCLAATQSGSRCTHAATTKAYGMWVCAQHARPDVITVRAVASRANGQLGGRPKVQTPCPRCKVLCDGFRVAREHCRNKPEYDGRRTRG